MISFNQMYFVVLLQNILLHRKAKQLSYQLEAWNNQKCLKQLSVKLNTAFLRFLENTGVNFPLLYCNTTYLVHGELTSGKKSSYCHVKEQQYSFQTQSEMQSKGNNNHILVKKLEFQSDRNHLNGIFYKIYSKEV